MKYTKVKIQLERIQFFHDDGNYSKVAQLKDLIELQELKKDEIFIKYRRSISKCDMGINKLSDRLRVLTEENK